MTHVTEPHPPPAAPDVRVQGGRSAALATAFVRGGLAAGLGLGAFAVLVIGAWIASPHADGGPGGALHTAAGLWLLAHGADLIRVETATGVPAPLGVTPLLLSALPLWLAHRVARDTADPGDARPAPSPVAGVAAVASGYLLVAAVVVVYTEAGTLPADLFTTGVWAPAAVLAAAGAGAWAAHGRPLPGRERSEIALRAAGLALVVLLGGGALLAAGSLLGHVGEAQASFNGLAGEWSGRASVALLGLALLPNAAVWGAAYGLGPGFALGTGALVTPLGFTGAPAVPAFPLLAALPGHGPGGWPQAAAAAVPALAALALGRRVGRAGRAWSGQETALSVLAGASVCGAAVAVLAAVAGGPLGTGRLAAFGPVWWQTGAAAVLWCAGVGLPTALAVRAWGLRGLRKAAERAAGAPDPDLGATGASGAPLPVPAASSASAASAVSSVSAALSALLHLSVPARAGGSPEEDPQDLPGAPGVQGALETAGTGPLPRSLSETAGGLDALDGLDLLDPLDPLDDDSGDEAYGFLPAAWEPPAGPPAEPPAPPPERA
ncbi:DUF6350 family protein [Streptomyces sp. NPDC051921]|uniref:cell division protein PerM n=1 Tax=Streptomyces sp. NPDC051921 TaxID=3155806 RepID=UPI00342484A4